ncbi:MAG TPA: hypothetical protein VJU16_04750, partial [Planctomycetota bacterium]|nr:hypothetical protein [Planctomycetota bacterium]
NERPGGMAIDSGGLIHLTLTVANTVRLVRFNLDGSFANDVQIATGITATAGGHSVVLDASNVIYTATTISNGQVLVRQYAASNLAQGWSTTFNSGLGSDRIESNGMAFDSTGSLVLAGGLNSLTGINHWLARVTASNGGVQWSQSPGLDLTGPTYWRGVTVGAGSVIIAAGDITATLSSQTQVQTAQYSSGGAALWENQFGLGVSPNVGNAVAVDSSGNFFTAGFLSTTSEGRNSFLLRYGSNKVISGFDTYNGSANGNDEILDVATDTDGSVYVVGYETVTGQGENMWVRKYDANLNEVWTRTHDGGVGNDRAISCAIFGNQLVVAGFQTVTGGQTKLVLRVYAK